MLRWYGYLGLLLILFAEINFYAVVQPFAEWYIVIVWSGYILFVDSLLFKIKGKSFICSYTREFAFMLAISIPFWLIFEFYNIFTHSWQYINYVWYVHIFDFATILPAVLETFAVLHALRFGSRLDVRVARGKKGNTLAIKALAVLGLVITLLPLFIGPLGFISMWIGLCLLFDPLNYLMDRPSLLRKASEGKKSILFQVSVAGLIMGFFWEFWNYQAYPKWVYTLPGVILNIRLFEMPIEGYLGYMAFGASTFLFYAFFRYFIFRKENPLLAM